MVVTPVVLLNLLNLINLYPIGAGRTDLIFFPILFIAFIIYSILKFKNFNYLSTNCVVTNILCENNKVRR